MARFTNLSSFTTGRKTVAVPGTPELLSATSQPIPPGVFLVIKAMSANTGTIYVGNSSANANSATSTVAFRLSSTQAITLEIQNTNVVYIDASVAGEGVEYLFET